MFKYWQEGELEYRWFLPVLPRFCVNVRTNFDYVVAQFIAQYCRNIFMYIRLNIQQSIVFKYWRVGELEYRWFLLVLPCFCVNVRTHFVEVVAKVIARYCSRNYIYIRLNIQQSIRFEYWWAGELEYRWFLLFYLVFASTSVLILTMLWPKLFLRYCSSSHIYIRFNIQQNIVFEYWWGG